MHLRNEGILPRRKRRAFTLVEILIVILIIGMLTAIAIPHFMKAREGTHARSCQYNLGQIVGAKERWAMDNSRGATDTPDWNHLVGPYIKRQPVCPGEGTYAIGSLNVNPTCTVGGTRGEWNAHVLP